MSTVAEVEASELFADESVNWRYCMREATFSHRKACEFVVHVGDPLSADGDVAYCDSRVVEMREFGCTEEFVEAYLEAVEEGATRVLFWA